MKQFHAGNIKKSNLIICILTLAFIAILVSFIFDFTGSNLLSLTLETTEPSVIEINEDHGNQPVSHGAPGVGCADCHLDPIYNISICTDLCHYDGGMTTEPPAAIGGGSPGENVTMPHHDEDRLGFKNCLNYICHENPDHEEDARYVILSAYQGHDACMCHDDMGHS